LEWYRSEKIRLEERIREDKEELMQEVITTVRMKTTKGMIRRDSEIRLSKA
jgi:hypothetical protein